MLLVLVVVVVKSGEGGMKDICFGEAKQNNTTEMCMHQNRQTSTWAGVSPGHF